MSADDSISLREYVDLRFADFDKALVLQRTENDRRLDELNHAHTKAVEVQHTYVTQEKYDDFIKSNELSRAQLLGRIIDRLDALENWKARATGVSVVLILFAGTVGAAIERALT